MTPATFASLSGFVSLAIPYVVLAILVAGVALGATPAYWAAKATTAVVKNWGARHVIETGVEYAQQWLDKAQRYDGAVNVATAAAPWLKKSPILKPLVEAAVLRVHTNLGIYDAELKAADAGVAPHSVAPADLEAIRTEARAIAAQVAQDTLRGVLTTALGGQGVQATHEAAVTTLTPAPAPVTPTPTAAPFKIVDATTNEAIADVRLPAAQTMPLTGGAPTP